jgi:HSP20 family protein
MEDKKNVALVRSCCNALVRGVEESEMIIYPAADIYETHDAFIVELDMPGVTKESITVTADAQVLSVKSSRTTDETKRGVFLMNEIGIKKYQREFRLGSGIKLDEINAEYSDGVLLVTLPKADEVKARHIQIQ